MLCLFCIMASNTTVLRRCYLYSPITDDISLLVVILDGLLDLLSNGIVIVFL
jgi:hypothetical protein